MKRERLESACVLEREREREREREEPIESVDSAINYSSNQTRALVL